MKAIYLSPRRTAAEMTAKYAQAIADAGIDLTIFTTRPSDGLYRKGIVPASVPVRVFGDRWKPSRLPRLRGLRRLRSLPLPSLNYVAAVLCTRADFYIAGEPNDLWLADYAARIHGGRLVYIPFEYYPFASYAKPAQARKWLRIETRCAPRVAAWISLGDKLSEDYRERYGVTAHTVYTGYPRATKGNRPRLRERLGVARDALVVLYQGVVREKRGVYDVIEALRLLPDRVHFAVLGMGELDECRARAARLGLQQRVHVLDAVPQNELLDYTMDADVGVVASHNMCRSYALSSGSKVFEYLAVGLPLAVCNLEQMEWFVNKHGLGVVFEVGSPESIAAALRRLLDDGYRRRCADNSRRLQDTEVCWEVQAAKLREAVLGGRAAPRAARGCPRPHVAVG